MRFRPSPSSDKPTQPFAALIDVVFLLLIFFLVTLRVSAPEGDLRVDMPTVAPGPVNPVLPEVQPPVTVRLVSAADGSLQEVRFGARPLGGGADAIDRLRGEVRQMVRGRDRADALTADIEADATLDYAHFVAALSACTGEVRPVGEGGRVVQFPVHVRFAPPRG